MVSTRLATIDGGSLSLAMVFAAGLLVAADFDDPTTHGVKRTWSSASLKIPTPLGGLLFDPTGTKLYVVGGSESSGSTLYEVPVTRDTATREVTDLGPSEATRLVFEGTDLPPVGASHSGLDAGFEWGPNGTLFYTYWAAHYMGQRPGGVLGTEALYDMAKVRILDPERYLPASVAGLTFSPHVADPATAFGLMQVSVWSYAGERELYDVPLTSLGNGLFQPLNAVMFATLPRQGTGAIQYIPTGPRAGDMMYVNWDYGEILILAIDPGTGLPIDDATGQPTRGTNAPRVQRFAYNLGVGPWGLEFDPRTNDFFVSTYRGNPSNTILQIGGFPPPRFVRGDVNADGRINIADPIAILYHLFALRRQPPCADTGDANDDGAINVADATLLLNYLFRHGRPLPAPFGACGVDPSDDVLGCALFPPCSE